MKVVETKEYFSEWDDADIETGISVHVVNNLGEFMNIRFAEGESEDMSMGRDLRDAFLLTMLIKFVYEAGKRGEELEIIYEEER